jgi:ATP-binding cassette, subfamily G (WHITE), member 2, PDR
LFLLFLLINTQLMIINSGCSTFLKTIAGETQGFYIDDKSNIQYQGITAKMMHKDFRGEVIYMSETDVHFPMLTVGDTLTFAARARAPHNRLAGITREQYAIHMRDVVMALFGLTHTVNTMVGNDFIRGISGGERKRVSIAECTLSFSPIQCWDNSTRGLDSANALEFIRTVRMGADAGGSTAMVSVYQCSQSSYDVSLAIQQSEQY